MRKNKDTMLLNNITYMDYYNRLMLLALSTFEWTNVPEGIDTRFLELQLYETGTCLFFYDENIGYLSLPANINGKLNLYGIPTRRYAYSRSEYRAERDITNSVIIRNNLLQTPTKDTIRLYAQRLYDVQRTIDVNVKRQKQPVIIKTDDNSRLSMRNLYDDYDGNEPVFVVNKNFIMGEMMEVLELKAEYNIDKLTMLKHDIWDECLTFLGLNNANTDKKERLITSEVDSNLEHIEMSLQCMLSARQYACDEINKMFDLNIGVKFKLDSEESEELEADELDPEETEDTEDVE